MKDSIYATKETETVEGLKEWCLIDVTDGAVPLKKQLQSAARAFKKTRPFASGVMSDFSKSLA